MRTLVRLLFLLCTAPGCALTPPAVPSLANADTVQERALYLSVNAHRDSLGSSPLIYDHELSNIARRHSQEMASGVVPFGHQGFASRAAQARELGYRALAENVGTNGYDPDLAERVAFEGFIHSPRHRHALEGDYRFTGVGAARAERGDYYFTQLFAR
jgi:uncharacterized protein YkwD